jgi:Tfp pilus assembly protein PilF
MTAAPQTAIFLLTEEDRARLRADVAARGFAAFGPPGLDDEVFQALRAEAEAQRAAAWERSAANSQDQHVWRANLGPVAKAFLGCEETLSLLRDVVGCPVAPSFEATCYTYYDASQHFLGVHLDRANSCFVTLILYLQAVWPEPGEPSAGLRLFVFDPQAGPEADPILVVTSRPNRCVIGRGAEFPHTRPPLEAGETVHALTACFAAAPAAARPGREDAAAAHAGPALAITVPDPAEARGLTDQGYTAWNRGDAAGARSLFEQALGLNPEDELAWSGLGHARWSEGEFEAARLAFVEAARRDGYNPAHWSNLGLCLRDLGRHDEALNMFAAALALDPEYAPACNEWANVLQDLGRHGEALPHYYKALALDPSRAVVHHNLGVAYSRLQDDAQALYAFVSAVERDPNYAPSLEEIGVLYAKAGESEGAREAWRKAGTPRASRFLAELEAAAAAPEG